MGVQGLTTFVEGNKHLLQDVKFRDSRLVIDGCSLYFRLYFNYGLDQLHGGDYDAFTCLLNQFFSALETCNIQPYVVLDGGVDPSDKKFPTMRQRLQSKIKEADSLSRGRNGCVLPILTRNVFIQVLIQRGVPLVQCLFEADREIACLAHQWKCPVLSNDSDFYIFDLPGGYLPLHFFHWSNLNGKASQRYISARCYTTNGLCRWFGGMNRELLPLCAVLTGNDYGNPKDAETLLSLLDVNALRRGGGRGKSSTSRIEGVLLWLSSFSCAAKALEEVSGLMKEEMKAGGGKSKRGQNSGLSSQLWAGMQEYRITSESSLARWFSVREPPGGSSSWLPECLSLVAAQGLLDPLVVNAVVMHRALLIPQVENSKLASSHCCARSIRQAMYGILTQRDQDVQPQDLRAQEIISQGVRGGRGRGVRGWRGGQTDGSKGQGFPLHTQQGVNVAVGGVQAQIFSVPMYVDEYDRLDLNLKKNQVEARPPRNPLHLDTIGQIPVAVRLGVFLEVLGTKETALAPVPLQLRLAVAVTGFWMREATPTPSPFQLQALVLAMVYGELSWNNLHGSSDYRYPVPQLDWSAERNVLAGLDKLRLRPGSRRGLDVGVAHSLSQWQACVWSALCLNQLLLLPIPEPHLSWLFSGTLIHGFVSYLKGGRAAESLLVGGSLSRQLYFSLMEAVRSCSSKNHHSSLAGRGRKRGRGQGGRGRGQGSRGRGRGGRGARGGGRGTDEFNNRFALLMSEEEYDEFDY
ncbi:single-strand DNA endonuclease ASTE1 [Antennarius striatus]|uniref:single-strand DNA endonuclease ASTE1 n=1 Tax=Antennarius striatus TaxID=241820 RepID=UPI0035AEEA6D